MGDVYPKSTKLPKGDYILQLYLRYVTFFSSCMKGQNTLPRMQFLNIRYIYDF